MGARSVDDAREIVVHEFDAGHQGTVRVRLGSFKGQARIDIRLWVEPRDVAGADLIPTGKGINLAAEYVDDLLEAVQALAATVDGAPAIARRSA